MYRPRFLTYLMALAGLLLMAVTVTQAADVGGGPVRLDIARSTTQSVPLSSLIHRVYTARDGAPDQVTALAQTSEGFLWLGSSAGISRFDGVAFDTSFSKQLSSPNVSNLFADDADLWIGYIFGGVARLHDGKVTNYDWHGLPGGSIVSFARRSDGVLWVATVAGLARYVDGRWQAVTGFPGQRLSSMFSFNGSLWVREQQGWYVLEPHEKTFHFVANSEAGGLLADDHERTGNTASDGNETVLNDASGARWSSGSEDLQRERWVSGRREPIVETLTRKQGLSGTPVRLLQDREGNIWVGTTQGLDQFRVAKFVPLPLPGLGEDPAFALGNHDDLWVSTAANAPSSGKNGKSISALSQAALSVARGPHGVIWSAGDAGLNRSTDAQMTSVALPGDLLEASRAGILGRLFQAIAVDAEGGLWVSVVTHDLYRLKDGVWTSSGGLSDLPPGPAIRLLADAAGRLWITYPANKIAMVEHGKVINYTAADGLAVGNVLGIAVQGGKVWVCGDLGVAFLQHGHFVTLHGVHGEDFHATAGIVETAAGELWLDSARGVYRIGASELQGIRKNPAHVVSFELFDQLDGLRGAAISLRPGPTLQLGADGRVWVGRFNGISSIDPQHILRNKIAPKALIEALHVADQSSAATDGLVLPKLTRSLRLDYTAASLVRPDLVHFRYQLEGVDDGWQDAETRRQAFYTNLGPGSYRFRVRAANEDGLWSTHDAVFDFRIAPAFYQTWWFHVLCGLAALAILWLLYLLRLRQLAARVRIRTVERERIARDLHDTLLQGVQGLQLRLQTWAVHKLLAPELRDEVNGVAARTRDLLIDGRDRIIALRRVDMRPAELIASLGAICEEYAAMYHLKFSLKEHGQAHALAPEAAAEALDIAREGLRNAFVHASAKQVEVSVDWKPGALQIRVRDDGCGIDEVILREGGRAGHWGLLGMRERAAKINATLNLQRCDEGGTELQLTVPARVAYAAMPSRLWRWMRRTRHRALN